MKTLKTIFGIIMLLSMFISTDAFAQKGKGKHGPKNEVKHHNGKMKHHNGPSNQAYRKSPGPPPWAPAHGYRAKHHVYFPDYHVFYDARRSGYVYWNNGGWVVSASIPAFLASVDLGRARVQVMSDLPLTARPEYYYDDYVEVYPGRRTSAHINIHIPVRVNR